MADAIISNLKEAAEKGDTNSVDCILNDITEAMKYIYAFAGRTDQPRVKSLLEEQFNPDTFEDSKVNAAIDSQHDIDTKGLISVILNEIVPFLENAMQSPKRLADILCDVRSVIPGGKMLDYILHEMVFLTLKCAVKTKDMGLLEDNLANMDMVVTRLVGIDLKWLTSILSSLHAAKAKDTESLKPILYDMTIPGLCRAQRKL